ncbi:MAG: hypothetical protein VB131_04920 [Burkholderia gladioli]
MTKHAENCLEHGAQFPFDAPDSWRKNYPNEAPPDCPDWAHAAARGVLADLTDRRGIKQELVDLDADVRAELVGSVAEIIRAAHAAEQSRNA